MLTAEQREERRIARNTKRRAVYAERKLWSIAAKVPERDRNLFLGVLSARNSVSGRLKANAEYIVLMWNENMPKVGWRDDAREIVAAVGGVST